MNIVTGCSGIDAIAYAATLIDIELIGEIELDEFCNKILELRYPGVKRLNNIFDVRGDEFGTNVDIFAAGFPCQSFSHAGKRKGDKDDRYICPEVIRIIRTMQPTYFIGENVLGITSMERSDSEIIMETETDVCTESEMVLETIRKDLQEAGYESVTIVIPACSVGAPHQRYRVFVVAHNNSFRHLDRRFKKQSAERLQQTQSKFIKCNSSETLGNSERTRNGELPIQPRESRETDLDIDGAGKVRIMDDTNQQHGNRTGLDSGEILQEQQKQTEIQRCSMANTAGEGLQVGEQPGRCENAEKTGTGLESKLERCSEDVADTNRNSKWSGEGFEQSKGNPTRQCFGNSSIVADTECERQQKQRESIESSNSTQDRDRETSGIEHVCVEAIRSVESGLDRNFDGISTGLHGPGGQEDSCGIFSTFEEIFTTVLGRIKWPAGYGAEQYGYEPPRVATGVKNRVNRLKALGNAIVPFQILPFLLAIKLIEAENKQ
jgi:DNA-cytosine methyltransferase